jgi:hypothetical protein
VNRRYGYSAYTALGALTGGVVVCGFQLRPVSIVAGAVVGALFGVAVQDAL